MKVYKQDLSDIVRNYLLSFLTHSNSLHSYRVAFEYIRCMILNNRSQYGFIVTDQFKLESLRQLIVDNEYDDIIIATTYDDPVYLHEDNSVIIFDSLKNLMGNFHEDIESRKFFYNLLNRLKSKFNQVIAIVDNDMYQEDIAKVCSIDPKMFLYLSDKQFTFINKETNMLYYPKIHDEIAIITKEQEAKLNSIIPKSDTPEPLNWINDEYRIPGNLSEISPKKYFNIVYPYQIEAAIKSQANLSTLDYIIDIFGEGEILKFAPKFRKLFDKITMSLDEGLRHVIFTAYPNISDDGNDGDFGGDLIWILLTKKYNLRAERLYDSSSDEEKFDTLQRYNNGEFDILITNCYFMIPPVNVNHFHVIDSDLKTAFDMIDVIYKDINYGKEQNPDFDIHLYYLLKDEKELPRATFDSYDFYGMKNYIQTLNYEKNERWDKGWKVSIVAGRCCIYIEK